MRIVHYVCPPHDLVTRELIVEGEVSLCTEHHDKDYKQVCYIEGDGPTPNRYAISLTEDELVRILQVHNVHYAGKSYGPRADRFRRRPR